MKKFKHLWIIGNGFDRSCGLKTGYSDFLNWYKHTTDDFMKKALELKQNKKRSKYFKTNNPLAEIFDEPMNINRDTFFSLDYYINNYNSSVIKWLKNKIINDNDDKKVNWSDLELKLGYITKDTFINNSPEKYGLCIDNLHLALNEYLLNEDKKAELQGDKLFEEFRKNKRKAFKKFDNIDIDDTVFVVLNYTKNFERFIKFRYPDKIPAIVYLHGTVYDDNTVLGIGSEFQIFNPDFAKNPKVTQRLLKTEITMDEDQIFYADFNNFFLENLACARDEVNIFGCSLGGSDMFLWYSFLEPYFQKETGKLNIYGIDINDYCDPKAAKENEIICNILFYYSSTLDNKEILENIFIDLISVMEEYIEKLEKKIPENNRQLKNYQKENKNGDMGKYLDSIDKYLRTLEMKYGKIDTYAIKIDNLLNKINESADKAEKSQHIINQNEYKKKLDKIVSDEEYYQFKETLDNFRKTGKLDISFFGLEPGIYPTKEEPFKTLLDQLDYSDKNGIKMIIAQSKGEPVTDSALEVTDHTYSFKRLEEYANKECDCKIDEAIEKIRSIGKNGEFIFDDELTEVNPIYKDQIEHAIGRIKKLFVYHSLS